MKRSSLDRAKQSIMGHFSEINKQVFRLKELFNILSSKRIEWNLTESVSSNSFLKYLIKENVLSKVVLDFPNRKETRFVIGKIDIYKLLMTINEKSYFSHLTALHFNNLLTDQPLTLYWNAEQIKKNLSSSDLSQDTLTNAFKNKARISNNVCQYQNVNIFGISGMKTDNLGVIEKGNVRYTDLERTLIDIAVRPQYSNGPKTILESFEKAKNQVILGKLIDYYKTINYTYPYHQSIGFYLERTNYPNEFINSFSKFNQQYDFYLDNQIKTPKFSKKWRIFYPSELDKI